MAATSNLPEGWTFEALDHEKEYVFPAGAYFFGDFPYFDDENWTKTTPFTVFDHGGFEDGLYKHKDGGFFLVAQTAYGDGCFTDSHGRGYGVDGGCLVLMSKELFSEEMLEKVNTPRFSTYHDMGHILTFPDDITCVFTGRGYGKDEEKNGQYKITWEPADELDTGILTLDTASYLSDEEEEIISPKMDKAVQTVEAM